MFFFPISKDLEGKFLSKSLQESRKKKRKRKNIFSTLSWFQLIKKFNMSTFTTMDLNNNLQTRTKKRWTTTYRGPSPKTAKGGKHENLIAPCLKVTSNICHASKNLGQSTLSHEVFWLWFTGPCLIVFEAIADIPVHNLWFRAVRVFKVPRTFMLRY